MLNYLVLCLFAILINYNFINYNESFLLCVFFLIFFIIIYIIINKSLKTFNFLKIFKNFYLLLLIMRFNYYFYKLLISYYVVKFNILKNCILKIKLVKKNFNLIVNGIFENYIILFNLVYFYSIGKNYTLIKDVFNLIHFNFIGYYKINDNLLFF